MDFYSIIIYGYLALAAFFIYVIGRDQKNKKCVFGRHKILAWFIISALFIGIAVSVYARFVEPYILLTKKIEIINDKITNPIKIALITDIHAGNGKKTKWVEKIVKKVETENPDIVLIAGDLICNEGIFEDETVYLEPLQKLADEYPVYATLGNHEYGIGNVNRFSKDLQTGDKSEEVITMLNKIGVHLLINRLRCIDGEETNLCLFGLDDIWGGKIDFTELYDWDQSSPLVFLSHNPDGAMLWPEQFAKPILMLSGHSHGGQIWIPFIGPLGNAGISLGENFYKGLNYYNDIPIYTSAGTGESGGAIRLFNPPEIIIINITP